MDNLPKCQANYTTLTPLTFLMRASASYANRLSVIHDAARFTWSQTYDRCRRLASSLRALNIAKNDVVSVLAPNIPAMYEMHFAVPMAGAVLNTINIRLDAKNIATILRHAESKVFFVDYEFVSKAKDALRILMEEKDQQNYSSLPLVIVIDDINTPTGIRLGTTSEPKGVVYSHRGAYLSTLSLILGWEMGSEPVYLWTLPMFHCNGWTFTWGIAARGGAKASEKRPIKAPVNILTGGAPPPASLLEKIEPLGFHVTHAYGLTEATGPALVCEWQKKWNELPKTEQSMLKARQGVSILTLADVDVKNLETMESVARDGKTMGEIVLKGSGIMMGYFKDGEATAKAFGDGWFRTGDVGVIHGDGYLEIKDRSKDVIISGGENISSVEVENVLYSHPKVLEAAVVAMPHPKWGESPCAFVSLMKNDEEEKSDYSCVTQDEIIGYCRKNLPHFMVPKMVVLMKELPKTATGKIQKFELRVKAKCFVMNDDEKNKNKNKNKKTNNNQVNQNNYQIMAMSRL
ncbi:unnamed protein product [Vicia faba]|uniref:Uncharacterized protein n=1 Tax=Vicia faba TaxID=3906 RepID=A0AAV0ZFG6_VICFA|nr:unnamed protein product [Vicia faba]